MKRLWAVRSGPRSVDPVRFDILFAALPVAPRAGEAFAVELLTLVPDAMAGADPANEPAKLQGKLLERALFLAGHYGRADLVARLVDRFLILVATEPDEEKRFVLVAAVAGQGLKSLRKFGQTDAVDRMLRQLQGVLCGGDPVENLRTRYAVNPAKWYAALQALLRLAGGWLAFGRTDEAAPIVSAARAELLGPVPRTFPGNVTVGLVRAYVAALGQGPAAFGLPRLEELFRTMPPSRVPNSWTPAPVYSLNHVLIVEEVVLALTGDEFTVGAAARRWLDEEERLVRQRVHADVRRLVAGAGL